MGTPRVIIGSITNFDLHFRVVHDHIGPRGVGREKVMLKRPKGKQKGVVNLSTSKLG